MMVEKADNRDLAEVMGIVAACVALLRSQGVFQWDEVYPDVAAVEADLGAGSLYVIRRNGACAATVCLNEDQPAEYARLPWSHVSGRALIIHRLCVHPDWQGRGLAAGLLAFAEKRAVERGYAAIRFDVYSGNPGALALYERHGYRRVVGTVYFPRRELPFYCYEKKVGEVDDRCGDTVEFALR